MYKSMHIYARTLLGNEPKSFKENLGRIKSGLKCPTQI
jgi:hypothetical protein